MQIQERARSHRRCQDAESHLIGDRVSHLRKVKGASMIQVDLEGLRPL
jgi:hypothetical protein